MTVTDSYRRRIHASMLSSLSARKHWWFTRDKSRGPLRGGLRWRGPLSRGRTSNERYPEQPRDRRVGTREQSGKRSNGGLGHRNPTWGVTSLLPGGEMAYRDPPAPSQFGSTIRTLALISLNRAIINVSRCFSSLIDVTVLLWCCRNWICLVSTIYTLSLYIVSAIVVSRLIMR